MATKHLRFDVEHRRAKKEAIRAEIYQGQIALRVPGDVRLLSGGEGEINGPSIMWKGTEQGGKWKVRENVEECFQDFLGLANAPDQEVLDFVRKWGPLNQSAHQKQYMVLSDGTDVTFTPRTDYSKTRPVVHEGGSRFVEVFTVDCPGLSHIQLGGLKKAERLFQAARIGENEGNLEGCGVARQEAMACLGQIPYNPIDFWFFEQTGIYRSWARQAQALLNIAANLYGPQASGVARTEAKCASIRDWQVAICPHEPESVTPNSGLDFIWSDDVKDQRFFFCEWASQWYRMAAISPTLAWGTEDAPNLSVKPETLGNMVYEQGAEIRVAKMQAILESYSKFQRDLGDSYGLFPLLTIQLTSALTSPRGISRCSLCGSIYNPKGQRARSDRPNYCDSCSVTRRRERERTSRARKKLRDAGIGVSPDPNHATAKKSVRDKED